MNTKDALEILFRTFADYSFHRQFIIELGDLLKSVLKGKENRFFKCLITQLNYIKILGIAVHKADGHEIIRGFDGHYYSIHLQHAQFNVRFLVHIDNSGKAIFLCAFNEREGHRQTSYEKYINVCEKRYEEMRRNNDE